MIASTHPGQEAAPRAALPPDSLPLDSLPLDMLPLDRAPQRSAPAESASPPEAAPSPRPARRRAGLVQEPPARQPREQSRPHERRGAALAPARRRPLSRFTEVDENPSFYLSLSDLMCLLVVFFVLIFSLSDKSGTAPAPPTPQAAQARPAPKGMVKGVVKASVPAIGLRLPTADPFPNPEPIPPGVRLSMVSVASAGQGDPGLIPEPALLSSDDAPRGPGFDRALLTLVSAGAPLPAAAAPAEEPGLGELLGQVSKESKGMEMERAGDKVVLRLPESITFDLGRSEIKPGMQATLQHLAQLLTRHPEVPVTITGHTDDLPIHTPQFASNWELSGARAASVGRALMAQGLEQSRLTIRGLADRQPRLPNTSETNRSQNRRVEIELRLNG